MIKSPVGTANRLMFFICPWPLDLSVFFVWDCVANQSSFGENTRRANAFIVNLFRVSLKPISQKPFSLSLFGRFSLFWLHARIWSPPTKNPKYLHQNLWIFNQNPGILALASEKKKLMTPSNFNINFHYSKFFFVFTLEIKWVYSNSTHEDNKFHFNRRQTKHSQNCMEHNKWVGEKDQGSCGPTKYDTQAIVIKTRIKLWLWKKKLAMANVK